MGRRVSDEREAVTIDGRTGRVIPDETARPRAPRAGQVQRSRARAKRARHVSSELRADAIFAQVIDAATDEIEREIRRFVRGLFR